MLLGIPLRSRLSLPLPPNPINPTLQHLLPVDPHRLHPPRINIIRTYVRRNIVLLNQISHKSHAHERPLVLFRWTQVLDLEIFVPWPPDRLDVV